MITRSDAVGGATIHVRDLASALQARGHQVLVFTGGTGPVTDQMEARGIPVHSLRWLRRSVNPLHDSMAVLELRRVLKRWRPDLVSAHTSKAGWTGRAAAHSLNIPAVYTPHGWTVTDRLGRAQGLVYTVAEKIAAQWCEAIVCVSKSERSLARQKKIGTPGQLRVIYNGVGPVGSALKANPGTSPVRIVSVARLEEPKDHAVLLDAFATISDPDSILALVGDGPLEASLRTKAERLGIGNRVQFTGYLPEPAEALAKAQIFVLSSRSEAFPRSILEAMRAGLPVVASDVGGVREAVQDGTTGLLVPARDSGALARALERLIKNADDRQQLGAAGHQTFVERFSFERTLEATENLYVTLLKDGRP